MEGPYGLDSGEIRSRVAAGRRGVYVLSRDSSGTAGHYVGRSDTDLAARLADWVGSQYRRFWFEYSASAEDAAAGERRWFEQLGGLQRLDNEERPR